MNTTATPTGLPTTVRFVWVAFSAQLFSSFFWVVFVWLSWKDRREIAKRHTTVSSYCCSYDGVLANEKDIKNDIEIKMKDKDKKKDGEMNDVTVSSALKPREEDTEVIDVVKFEFRRLFLVVSTTVIGLSMAGLLVDEFNSRPDESPPVWWVEFFAACLLPCVGFFPTDGNGSRKFMFCGFIRIPIIVSSFIHGFTALSYFIVFTATNLFYAVSICQLSRSKPEPWPVFLTFSIIAAILLVAFMIIQGIIFWLKGIRLCCCRPKEKVTNKKCSFYFKTVWKMDISDSKWDPENIDLHYIFAMASYNLECVMMVMVTIVGALGSIKRNRHLPKWDGNWPIGC